jgi:hypothetical protein
MGRGRSTPEGRLHFVFKIHLLLETERLMVKGRITRMKPPLIAQHLPMEHGPASLEEIRIMVDNTAQLPEYEYQHKQGQLGGIVPERLDPLDTGLLHHIGMPSDALCTMISWC